ncbi:hypothetical protein [Mycolicibacterium aubagnense]|uniref:hypothetical protein n=1 Tax=Mycolicibacterium aubagnense TaxID=319707 RepID=UPI0010FF451C|nr:hypothetical protein [Mycolicibacterium aubagnense]WGI33937.1 hypothetical protein QDT91_06170 [Mycolicibacterium aubagnense]
MKTADELVRSHAARGLLEFFADPTNRRHKDEMNWSRVERSSLSFAVITEGSARNMLLPLIFRVPIRVTPQP